MPAAVTSRCLLIKTASLLACLGAAVSGPAEEPVSFNRDIRPILAEHCWQCHGPDRQSRQAHLRLDQFQAATQPADSGAVALVPGQPQRSELLRRVTAEDDSRMPPREFNKPLTDQQIKRLQDWIAQGARFQTHWAFQVPVRPAVPEFPGVSHPIDAFVLQSLRRRGREFAPEADPATLLRRTSLVLTGLPPTVTLPAGNLHPEPSSAKDTPAPQPPLGELAYQRAVDALLSSPHLGEHLAATWLDAARYADTNGYFGDRPRQMWLWRDWVIDALNHNMPFDQFTLEQLAGDLLPDATLRQRIATGFNRNHMANNETGIIDEEYRVQYVVDRVDTTLTTWMGLSAGCAQCHDHKYDPISQREFYQLFAYFNNVPEKGLITSENPPPVLAVTTERQQRRREQLETELQVASDQFAARKPQLDQQVAKWESRLDASLPSPPATSLLLAEPFEQRLADTTRAFGTALEFEQGVLGTAAKFEGTGHTEPVVPPEFDSDAPWTIGFWMKPDGTLSCLLSKIEPAGRRRGLELLLQKGHLRLNLVEHWGVRALEVATTSPMAARQWHHVVVSYDGSRSRQGVRLWVNGKAAGIVVHRATLAGSLANDQPLRIGRRDEGLGYYGLLDQFRMLRRVVSDHEVADWFRGERLRGILATPPAARDPRQRQFLLDDFLGHCGDPAALAAKQRVDQARQALQAFQETIPSTLVMAELPEPRVTRILIRGQYNLLGEVVRPGVPETIASLPPAAPPNRLGFAQWIVAPTNPLTARVAVNRLWKQCFGEGLVRTMNDFGTQGELPTHPDLLDWLAVEFRESGWDVKRMLRLIVTSQTFRQDSRFPQEQFDPENRLLARGPSFRLAAEVIRDQALAAAGLLQQQVGGPSVKPYQPPGLWQEVSYNGAESYVPDSGAGLWRRSLYTYLKRQAPPPAFLAFDGPPRETCTIDRPRTNTPLQALVLLNDPTFVGASQMLAAGCLKAAASDDGRLEYLFRRVLGRLPATAERQLLAGLLQRQRQRYAQAPAAAAELLTIESQLSGDSPRAGELGAWTVVAQTVLNLHEAITLR